MFSKLSHIIFHFLIEKIETDNIWITPKNQADRGCQISVHVRENGKQLYQALTDKGVICDWREPDVIRIAPHFYTEVGEIDVLFDEIDDIIKTGDYKRYSPKIKDVT